MDFSAGFHQALTTGSLAALPLALFGGLLAGSNPCCLALYPAAAGACCARKDQVITRPLGNAVAFVAGVAIAVAALGVLAAYIGRAVVMSTPFRYTVAFLPILMGVYRLGWIPLPIAAAKAFRLGLGGAFGTGLLLALVIGPCGTPVLASVLSFAAYQQSLVYGGLLLFVYGIGNGLPLVLVGTSAGGALQRFEGTRFASWIDSIVGGLLILLGFYLLWRV